MLLCPFARETLDSGALAEAAPTQRAVKARLWFQLLGVEFVEYARQKGSLLHLKNFNRNGEIGLSECLFI